jgi:anti-sigma B factor antagonist
LRKLVKKLANLAETGTTAAGTVWRVSRASRHELLGPADALTVRGVGNLSTEEPISILSEEPVPGTILLRVGGEVDMLSSPTLRDSIASALSGTHHRLIVDLDHVEFLGTSGLAALVEARASAEQSNTELWLACSRRQVLRPLRIAGLIQLFQVAESAAGALAGTASDREPEMD